MHYGAGKIGRQEIFEALDFISYLRQTVVAPLILMKSGKLPRGVQKIETDAPDDVPALLETVACHDTLGCIRALRSIIDLYIELRKPYLNENMIVRQSVETSASEYLDTISKRFTEESDL